MDPQGPFRHRRFVLKTRALARNDVTFSLQ